jgi:YqjK-like protein
MSAIKTREVRRGRLLERISQQRLALAASCQPLCSALQIADQAIDGADRTRRWVARNPLAVSLGALVLMLWRPRGVFKLARNGLIGWRTWRAIRTKLEGIIG